jgi:integral membrane protein
MMIKIFKIVAILEGVSILLLFFFAMPMKYILGQKQFIYPIGMAHGILFVSYITLVLICQWQYRWAFKQFSEIILASLIPFGTFYIDKKYLKNV